MTKLRVAHWRNPTYPDPTFTYKLKGELFRILSDNLPLLGTVIPQRLLLPTDQLLFCFRFLTPVLMLTMR